MKRLILFLTIFVFSTFNTVLASDYISDENDQNFINSFLKDNKSLTKNVTIIDYQSNIEKAEKLNDIAALQPLFCGMKLIGNSGSVRILEAQQHTRFWVNMSKGGSVTRMHMSLIKGNVFHLDTSYQGITCLI